MNMLFEALRTLIDVFWQEQTWSPAQNPSSFQTFTLSSTGDWVPFLDPLVAEIGKF